MKIGILTYSRAYNFGAILQAYALQHTIKKMGHEAIHIDYQAQGVKKQYSYRLPNSIANIKIDLMLLITRTRRYKMDLFRRKMFFTSSKLKNQELSLLNTEFDSFIAGSDQVWNGICTNHDRAYFLNFVNDCKKKNSYAASFGTAELTYEEKKEYSNLLHDFNKISVRESSGAKLVEELIRRSVPVVLDPVFLLDKVEWENLAENIYGNYIFVFQYVSDIETIQEAYKIAKERNLDLYIFSSSPYARRYGKVILNIGVEEFLGYIRNAELIITDSFHCSAFSIIFDKEFYSKFRKGDPANTRLENLLELFDINDRNMTLENTIKKKTINYDYVNKKLSILRGRSLDYLNSILEELL